MYIHVKKGLKSSFKWTELWHIQLNNTYIPTITTLAPIFTYFLAPSVRLTSRSNPYFKDHTSNSGIQNIVGTTLSDFSIENDLSYEKLC